MIGIWTNKLGLDLIYSSLYLPGDNMICVLRRFHNAWEFWVYSVVYGLVVGPNYSISQTMMGELTPPGFEYMVGVALWSQAPVAHITQFFGLFGLSNRSASILGPNVIQVIVDKKGNNWKAFLVLFALSALGCLVAWFGINVPKGSLRQRSGPRRSERWVPAECFCARRMGNPRPSQRAKTRVMGSSRLSELRTN